MKTMPAVALAIVLSAACAAPPANAATAIVEFSAILTLPAPFPNAAGTVNLSAHYVLDTSVEDSNPSPTLGSYPFAVVDGTVQIGSETYTVIPGIGASSVIIRSGASVLDVFYVAAGVESEFGDNAVVSVELYSAPGTVLTSDAFPLGPLDESMFDPFDADMPGLSTSVFVLGLSGYPTLVQLEIESFRYAIVPVPAAAWLLLSAVVVLGRTFGRR